MKIEIEWDCSYEATMRISGHASSREMKVKLSPGCTTLDGLKGKECENTFGGILAGQLYSIVGRAMQAECIAADHVDPSGSEDATWKRLPNVIADAVEQRIS